MTFMVNQGHDVVHSDSYRTILETLTVKLELEAAKQLSKARLDTSISRNRGGVETSATVH